MLLFWDISGHPVKLSISFSWYFILDSQPCIKALAHYRFSHSCSHCVSKGFAL